MANATAVGTVKGGASFVYNVNDTATQVLAAKQIKENLFLGLLHRNGKGITEQTETDVSSIHMLKYTPLSGSARKLGEATNGGFFNTAAADVGEVTEYDLNLLYIYDKCLDIPEVQQDMCPANLFDAATKNIAGRINTEINASTIAHQLKAVFDYNFNNTGTGTDGAHVAADLKGNVIVQASTAKYYEDFLAASAALDNGDATLGIQSFPFDERQFLMRSSFRTGLMSANGVIIGGSNFAQSMLAKGGLDPESKKEFGTMYIGEIDGIPCYLVPSPIWARVKDWTDSNGDTFTDNVEGIMCAAQATDRGISDQSYVKIVDTQNGAGKRMQPKVRWGINACYATGIVTIVKNGYTLPAKDQSITIAAPGN